MLSVLLSYNSVPQTEKISEMGRWCIMLLLAMVTMYGVTFSDPILQRLRRGDGKPKAVPPGMSVESFVHSCELCGMFYGSTYNYDCLNDITFRTFRGCQLAVS